MSVSSMARSISMGARREVMGVVVERYRSAKRSQKGCILDELCATTGWHRKHAVRALRQREAVTLGEVGASRERRRRYGSTTKGALTVRSVPEVLQRISLLQLCCAQHQPPGRAFPKDAA